MRSRNSGDPAALGRGGFELLDEEALERGVDGEADGLGVAVGADRAVGLPLAHQRDHEVALALLDAAGDRRQVRPRRRRGEVQGGEQAVEGRARAVEARGLVDQGEAGASRPLPDEEAASTRSAWRLIASL